MQVSPRDYASSSEFRLDLLRVMRDVPEPGGPGSVSLSGTTPARPSRRRASKADMRARRPGANLRATHRRVRQFEDRHSADRQRAIACIAGDHVRLEGAEQRQSVPAVRPPCGPVPFGSGMYGSCQVKSDPGHFDNRKRARRRASTSEQVAPRKLQSRAYPRIQAGLQSADSKNLVGRCGSLGDQ